MTASLILVCDSIGSRHQFGTSGGAFGRSRKCDWVLPDQDRHLSSVHARIVYQNDTFILVDESTNGTFLEGQPAAIGRGKAVSLSPGMKLQAGPYQIRVEAGESNPNTATNPFSGSQGAGSSHASSLATPLRIDTSGASLPQNTSLDPLDHLGGGPETLTPVATAQTPAVVIPEPVAFSASTGPGSPHETTRLQGVSPQNQQTAAELQAPADLTAQVTGSSQKTSMPPAVTQQAPAPHVSVPPAAATPAPSQVPVATPTPAQPAASGNLIPEDFLAGIGAPSPAAQPGSGEQQSSGIPDLSSLMPPAQAETGQAAAPAAGVSTGSAAAPTIPDNIDFGLGAPAPASNASSTAAPGGAPSPTAAPSAMQGQPASPTISASPAPSVVSTPASAPATSAPLNPLDALKKRRAQREAELAQKAKSRAGSPLASKRTPAASPAAKPASSAPTVAPQVPPAVLPSAMSGMPPVSAPQTQPAQNTAAATPQPAKPAATAVSNTAPPANEQNSQEVFQALLSGLGFADADVPDDERAEIARASGEMVQELANGLIALLKARKTLKTEFRMYETRIQPEENNPFKHFNVGELAIDEMLFARKGGFLPPSDAAKEAFRDLQSHTMLTVAATQRAMRLLFESLSPETLAGEEDDGGLRLRGLGSKRGKFEAAKERHDRLRADFDAVVRQTIAEAFVQVEEEQARQQSKSFWENRKK